MTKTILIVDDSPFDRVLLAKTLHSHLHYRILQADSAKSCLSVLQSEKVDLVLLDILMSEDNGLDILSNLRESRNPMELPVILITAKTDTDDVVAGLDRGANDYITKPINLRIAESRIKTQLHLADLFQKITHLRELEAQNATITTYNHEINNPLAIAISCLEMGDVSKPENIQLLQQALWRISNIVKKTSALMNKDSVEYQPYTSQNKMLKIR